MGHFRWILTIGFTSQSLHSALQMQDGGSTFIEKQKQILIGSQGSYGVVSVGWRENKLWNLLDLGLSPVSFSHRL